MRHKSQDETFIEKYADCEKYIRELTKRTETDRRENTGEKFMQTIEKNTPFQSHAQIEKKKVKSFSEKYTIIEESESESSGDKEIINEIVLEEPVEIPVKPNQEENVQLSRSTVDSSKLKQSISQKRSPFSFGPLNSDDEDSD